MIKKFHIYLADLEPSFGAEPGKSRPVVVIQPNVLNETLETTIVCPLTTNTKNVPIIRVAISSSKVSGLNENSDIMLDQIRSIDMRRLKKHIGSLNDQQIQKTIEGLTILVNE